METQCRNRGILSVNARRIDRYRVRQWVPPPQVLNAAAPHWIPIVSCNWRSEYQRNLVRKLCYYAILTS
jgi:hypothetical protein